MTKLRRRDRTPPWESYKAEAKARGALAFELFVVMSMPSATPEDLKAQLPAHLDYQSRLERNGKLVVAGPMSDESGEEMQRMGLIVYRAGSFAEARAIAEADPMHVAGTRAFTLRRWMINEGGLSISIGLYAQTVELK